MDAVANGYGGCVMCLVLWGGCKSSTEMLFTFFRNMLVILAGLVPARTRRHESCEPCPVRNS